MIEEIEFQKYKRLENIKISLGSGVIAIMGTNGTCKSSLLHIVSNSYQTFNNNSNFFTDKKCMKIIKGINQMINPKIETLNRGDKIYNDPAPEHSGIYYKCKYSNGQILNFRKHNQSTANRYRIIPKYDAKLKERLPYGLVIYLGLSRLNAFGEYQDDNSIKNITSSLLLPEKYQNELLEKYNNFTHYDINKLNYEKMGELKKRGKFITQNKGYDSNTISAGEDNLMIILTALYSLKYYADSLKEEYKDLPGILLIDEIDATLHPEFQAKLLSLFKEICIDYKNLNIIFTSHSLSILQECNRNKNKIVYLTDNVTKVGQMDDPNEYKIKAVLENKLGRDYYNNNKIPILTEDEQARDFLLAIIDYFKTNSPFKEQCGEALQHVKLVETSFSSEALIQLFTNSKIDRQNLQMIAIIDGDKAAKANPTYSLISLPGNQSPERIIFKLCEELKERQDEPEIKRFLDRLMTAHACSIRYIEDNIISEIKNIELYADAMQSEGKSIHGYYREKNKQIYEKYSMIFIDMFKFWVRDKLNEKLMIKFYNDLKSCFKQNAPYYGLDHNMWGSTQIKPLGNDSQQQMNLSQEEDLDNIHKELEFIK